MKDSKLCTDQFFYRIDCHGFPSHVHCCRCLSSWKTTEPLTVSWDLLIPQEQPSYWLVSLIFFLDSPKRIIDNIKRNHKN